VAGVKGSRETTLWPAVVFSLILIGLAPFLGRIRRFLSENLESGYTFALALAFGLAVGAALALAIAGIRQGRRLRYTFLSVWILLMVGQLLFWSRSSAKENAVERLHFVFYGLVAILFYRFFRKWREPSALVVAVVAATMVGILDEGMQWRFPLRVADYMDIVVNAYAAFAGLWLAVAVWPLESFSWRLDRRSWSRLSYWSTALVVLLAVYFHIAHLGHVIEDPDLGTYRSLYTVEELERLAPEREAQWKENPPGRPQDLTATEFEDYYRSEGGWRLLYRDHAERDADNPYEAWMENLFLEKYYGPFLDLPDGGGSPFRWSARRRARNEAAQPETEPYKYVSPVGKFPRHSIIVRPTKTELWLGVAVVVGVLLVVPRWRRG
jgi:hypothetical protein